MKKFYRFGSALLAVFFAFTIAMPAASAQVRITEFMPNPTGADPDGEWVEITNEGEEPGNLNGYKLRDNDGEYATIAADLPIAPGESVVVCSNGNTAMNQGVNCDATWSGDVGFALENSDNSEIQLLTPEDEIAGQLIVYNESDVEDGISLKVDENGNVSHGTDGTYGNTQVAMQHGTPASNAVINTNNPSHAYPTVQAAINDAAPGDVVEMGAGIFIGALDIDKTLTLRGAGQEQTTIDVSAAPSYGIHVSADDVVLENFKVIGRGDTGSNGNYAIKIEGNMSAGIPAPKTDPYNVTVRNVTVHDSYRTGLDLNGIVGAQLENITVSSTAWGNGVALTDVDNATLNNITVVDNVWGGIALYTNGGWFTPGSSNILIQNLIGSGSAQPYDLYSQEKNGHLIADLQLPGRDYRVKNSGHRADGAQFTFYPQSLDTALSLAAGLNAVVPNDTSVVYAIAGNNWYVGPGMLIQTAINNADSGDTIQVSAGTYAENVVISEGIALVGEGSENTIISPASGRVIDIRAQVQNVEDLTIQGFTLRAGNASIALQSNSQVNDGYDGLRYTYRDLVVDMQGHDGTAIGLFDIDTAVLEDVIVKNSKSGAAGAIEMIGVKNIRIVNSAFENNSIGVKLFAVSGYEANQSITITETKFTENAVNIINDDSGVTIEASLNWWGSADGPGTISGVNVTPWDVSAEPGLQLASDLEPESDEPGQVTLPATVTFGGTDQAIKLFNAITATTGSDTISNVVAVTGVKDPIALTKKVKLETAGNGPVEIKNNNSSATQKVTVTIPGSTTIYGSDEWEDGEMISPSVVTPTGTAPAGFTFGATVLKIGSDDATLVFDKVAEILLEDYSGPVGYLAPEAGSEWQEIEICSEGSFEDTSSIDPGFPGECYVTNGTHTKILTYHFTTFAALEADSDSEEPEGPGEDNEEGDEEVATPVRPTVRTAADNTPEAAPEVAGEEDERDTSSTVTEESADTVAAADDGFKWYWILVSISVLAVVYYALDDRIKTRLRR